jgi:hypothetical protein
MLKEKIRFTANYQQAEKGSYLPEYWQSRIKSRIGGLIKVRTVTADQQVVIYRKIDRAIQFNFTREEQASKDSRIRSQIRELIQETIEKL